VLSRNNGGFVAPLSTRHGTYHRYLDKESGQSVKGGLYQTHKGYGQLYLHLTITGMGGSQLEPAIPAWPQVVGLIPDLITWLGSAYRICGDFCLGYKHAGLAL